MNQAPCPLKSKFERFKPPPTQFFMRCWCKLKGTTFKKISLDEDTCRYHKDYGHITEKCLELKNDIKAIIQRWQLKEYLEKAPEPQAPAPPLWEKTRRENAPSTSLQLGNILANVSDIMSRLGVGGESDQWRKAYARKVKGFMNNTKRIVLIDQQRWLRGILSP